MAPILGPLLVPAWLWLRAWRVTTAAILL